MKSKKDSLSKLSSNKRMTALVVMLTLSLGAMVSVFVHVGKQVEFDKQYTDYTSEQQVLSQRIAKYALEAVTGSEDAFDRLENSEKRFMAILAIQEKGSSSTGLPASAAEVSMELDTLRSTWGSYRENVNKVLSGRNLVLAVAQIGDVLNEVMPQLLELSEAVVGILVKQGAKPSQVRTASRQSMLSQRIVNNINKVLAGENAESATQAFAEDTKEFGRVLESMISGGTDTVSLRDASAQGKLREIALLFTVVSDNVKQLLDSSEELLRVQAAAAHIAAKSEELFDATTDLHNAYSIVSGSRVVSPRLAYFFGGLSLLILFWMGSEMYLSQRRRREVVERENSRNQEAILRLLDEMGNLAAGDLTTHTTVTEDFTGSIADSINYTIDALRGLVKTINDTSSHVSSSVKQTQAMAKQLANASELQSKDISSASTAVNEMAKSIDEVSTKADESVKVAMKSVDIAKKGGNAVQRTINGMDNIREQIQETSKRIKRLGESSQEIGDIVELINDIAEQTNILALNASIQAAMAGEAGRGFAVVADEVQRLAERSGNATKQIEALVRTIQSDTKEAVISMEQSTSGVVSGATLAEDAGEALEEIENVSEQLAALIQSISASARQQASAAATISGTMHGIQEITTQTSAGASKTEAYIGKLTKLAQDLDKSVAGFKLPE